MAPTIRLSVASLIGCACDLDVVDESGEDELEFNSTFAYPLPFKVTPKPQVLECRAAEGEETWFKHPGLKNKSNT